MDIIKSISVYYRYTLLDSSAQFIISERREFIRFVVSAETKKSCEFGKEPFDNITVIAYTSYGKRAFILPPFWITPILTQYCNNGELLYEEYTFPILPEPLEIPANPNLW